MSTHEFSCLYLSDSLPHPNWGERESSCAVLNCLLRQLAKAQQAQSLEYICCLVEIILPKKNQTFWQENRQDAGKSETFHDIVVHFSFKSAMFT